MTVPALTGTASRPSADGRSKAAKRFRQLVESFGTDLGGSAELSTADRALIAQAAAIVVRCEALQAAALAGDAVDDEALVRLSNAAIRIVGALRSKDRKRRPAHIPLRDRLMSGQ